MHISSSWKYMSIGENNTVVSAYKKYRHLQQYCSYLSMYVYVFHVDKQIHVVTYAFMSYKTLRYYHVDSFTQGCWMIEIRIRY